MTTLALMYAIAGGASIIACIPQIVQILKTRNVEGISLQTYDMWFVLQIVCLPYVLSKGDWVLGSISVLWAVYYASIILLIEHYRYPNYIRFAVEKLVTVLRLIPVHSK